MPIRARGNYITYECETKREYEALAKLRTLISLVGIAANPRRVAPRGLARLE